MAYKKDRLERKYNITIVQRDKEVVKTGKKYMIIFQDKSYTDYDFNNLEEINNYMNNNTATATSETEKETATNEVETIATSETETEIETTATTATDKDFSVDGFINQVKKCETIDELDKVLGGLIQFLKSNYQINSVSSKLTSYRNELKKVFNNDDVIPDIFKNTNKSGKVEHLALTKSYSLLPRNEIEKLIKDSQDKSNEKLDNKIEITQDDIEQFLAVAKQGIYQRDDVYYAIASLEALTGRRFIENAKLVQNIDASGNFKIMYSYESIAKKKTKKNDVFEIPTLEYSDGIIECYEWVRTQLEVSDKTKKEVTNNYLGMVNKKVKEYFTMCQKHDSDYPTSHPLRAYSANIAHYFYGKRNGDKRKFIEQYLAHDNDKSAKDYDRYVIYDEKNIGFKSYLLELDEDITISVSAKEKYDLEQLGGVSGLLEQVKRLKNELLRKEIATTTATTSETETETETEKETATDKTTTTATSNHHFDVLKQCVDKIIKHNEDKQKEDKIAITSRCLYELTGKRTPIISAFMKSECGETIAKYNQINGFGQKQNMGKDLKKRLGY